MFFTAESTPIVRDGTNRPENQDKIAHYQARVYKTSVAEQPAKYDQDTPIDLYS
jgi:hypothetical protein